MAESPGQSLPQQAASWGDLKAAYRLLSNDAVDPHDIQMPHRMLTRDSCGEHKIVLVVQDSTELDFSRHRHRTRGLGPLANGQGLGLVQHSSLAVTPHGELLGVLNQFWHVRRPRPRHETRKQRRSRWRESCLFTDTVAAVGQGPNGCRFVHVADRAADDFELFQACRREGAGFVIRARHDRNVDDHTAYLWSFMEDRPIVAVTTVKVSHQRAKGHRAARRQRTAMVHVRAAEVTLDRPHHTSQAEFEPKRMWAVYVLEDEPPEDVQEPIDWMLLTSEGPQESESLDQWARKIIRWYRLRWLIEEWHRVEKEGCRLEASQLDEVKDLQRLASLIAVIAVRILQLRNLAQRNSRRPDDPRRSGKDESQSPQVLQREVPRLWIAVVAKLAKCDPQKLTPRRFWTTIATRGGWLGRTHDPPPGWKVIWRGWYDITRMVQGAELFAKSNPVRSG